jgi:hypothetical protein
MSTKKEKMKLLLVIGAGAFLVGCASTSGVMPYGKDTYVISRTDNSLTASVSALKGEALKDASQFCAKTGNSYEVIGGYDVQRSFGKIPTTEIQFKCVKDGGLELNQPQQQATPNLQKK